MCADGTRVADVREPDTQHGLLPCTKAGRRETKFRIHESTYEYLNTNWQPVLPASGDSADWMSPAIHRPWSQKEPGVDINSCRAATTKFLQQCPVQGGRIPYRSIILQGCTGRSPGLVFPTQGVLGGCLECPLSEDPAESAPPPPP